MRTTLVVPKAGDLEAEVLGGLLQNAHSGKGRALSSEITASPAAANIGLPYAARAARSRDADGRSQRCTLGGAGSSSRSRLKARWDKGSAQVLLLDPQAERAPLLSEQASLTSPLAGYLRRESGATCRRATSPVGTNLLKNPLTIWRANHNVQLAYHCNAVAGGEV